LKEARATLEHLFSVIERVSPRHPAPPGWITSLHTALEPAVLVGRLDHYRLDDDLGITMAILPRRIGQALLAFDDLAMGELGGTLPDQK
jgi:hypothetical protein